MVRFQTKNPNLGKFWRVLQWKMLVHFMSIWSILRPLEIFNGRLVYFVVSWNIFPRFGMLYQEKSGNPGPEPSSSFRITRSSPSYLYLVWIDAPLRLEGVQKIVGSNLLRV
jgi:hypothetical protein